MSNSLSLFILTSTFLSTKADDAGPNSDVMVSSSVGSVAIFVILIFLCCYFCCRDKASSEGFRNLNNEEDSSTSRGSSNRPRRYFRGFRRNNFHQNQERFQHQPPTNVIVQPVVTIAVPPQNYPGNFPVAGGANVPPPMPTAPPPYDEKPSSGVHTSGMMYTFP